MKNAIKKAYASTKGFVKRHWVLIASGTGLVAVAVVTAVAWPAAIPVLAEKFVAVCTAAAARIANFLNNLFHSVEIPVPTEPPVVVTPTAA